MRKIKFISFWLLLTVCMTAVMFNSCDEGNGDFDRSLFDKPTEINPTLQNFVLAVGENMSLATPIVKWTSSDATIATVDHNGKVTAVSAGTVTITAQAGTVTVKTFEVIVLVDEDQTALVIGEEFSLPTTIPFDSAWTSSSTIATVDNSGKVTAKSIGSVTVTTATVEIIVTPPVVCEDGDEDCVAADEKITKKIAEVVGTYKFVVYKETPNPAAENVLKIGEEYLLPALPPVTWESGDDAIASADDEGKVTAVAVGTSTVTANIGEIEIATCDVVVVIYANISDDIDGVEINGVKWATRNIDQPGTFATTKERVGMLYQWNSGIAWATENANNWDKKDIPTGTTWEEDNDPSPEGWRVPTLAELQKLVDAKNVAHRWITLNGTNGRIYVDKVSGNALFLPVTGCLNPDNGLYKNADACGMYWSSNSGTGTTANTFAVYLYLDAFNTAATTTPAASATSNYRSFGAAVRCIAK